MPTTVSHKIYYPSGTAVPNVPVQSQTTAESVEAALNKVTKAPMVIAHKNDQTTSATVFGQTNVVWNTNVLLQGGMLHPVNSAGLTVPENGIYRLDARLNFGQNTGVGRLSVYINGVRQMPFESELPGGSNYNPKPAIAASFYLDAGDTVIIACASSLASQTVIGIGSFVQLSKVATV